MGLYGMCQADPAALPCKTATAPSAGSKSWILCTPPPATSSPETPQPVTSTTPAPPTPPPRPTFDAQSTCSDIAIEVPLAELSVTYSLGVVQPANAPGIEVTLMYKDDISCVGCAYYISAGFRETSNLALKMVDVLPFVKPSVGDAMDLLNAQKFTNNVAPTLTDSADDPYFVTKYDTTGGNVELRVARPLVAGNNELVRDSEVDFAYAVGAFTAPKTPSPHNKKGAVAFNLTQCTIDITPVPGVPDTPTPGAVVEPPKNTLARLPNMCGEWRTMTWTPPNSVSGVSKAQLWWASRSVGETGREEGMQVFYLQAWLRDTPKDAYWVSLGVSPKASAKMSDMDSLGIETGSRVVVVYSRSTSAGGAVVPLETTVANVEGTALLQSGSIHAMFSRPAMAAPLYNLNESSAEYAFSFAVGDGSLSSTQGHFSAGRFPDTPVITQECGSVGAAREVVEEDEDDFPLWAIILIAAGGVVLLGGIAAFFFFRTKQTKRVGFNEFMHDMEDIDKEFAKTSEELSHHHYERDQQHNILH
eukprot:TRINITY_DN222_c0_g1_i2.p1 TRINITY_DN222_c0_g1~~TRINITY_DN222_c0_g1_i2.p1  ORF type:complete len:531 (+),score=184.84 TRINITY_DN222_c0_g1_i2:1323-2915(+)